jgi:hypothetical protein
MTTPHTVTPAHSIVVVGTVGIQSQVSVSARSFAASMASFFTLVALLLIKNFYLNCLSFSKNRCSRYVSSLCYKSFLF